MIAAPMNPSLQQTFPLHQRYHGHPWPDFSQQPLRMDHQ